MSAKREHAASGTTDALVASMSFAQMERGGCDCDECGPRSRVGQAVSVIPATIQHAIMQYKRQKLGIRRTQDRRLVERDATTAVAVWNWTLPPGAEPLLEFGNSHRLIWIKRLSAGRLSSIGSGIVGSQAEEENRTVLDDWVQGRVMFVPSNGGKAVGWIHNHKDDDDDDKATPTTTTLEGTAAEVETRRGGGPAVLVIAKIPVEARVTNEEENDDDPNESFAWTRSLIAQCQPYRRKDAIHLSIPLSTVDAKVVKEVMAAVVDGTGEEP
jgi:hypothetical protein